MKEPLRKQTSMQKAPGSCSGQAVKCLMSLSLERDAGFVRMWGREGMSERTTKKFNESDYAVNRAIFNQLKGTSRNLSFKDILTNCHYNTSEKKRIIYHILNDESKRSDGLFIKINDKYELRKRVERRLRKRIRREFTNFQIFINNDENKQSTEFKELMRKFHSFACKEKYEKNAEFLKHKEKELLEYFADGDEINVNEIWPKLELVKSETRSSELFRYATLLWSVPVSEGFGRRVRFLVWDEYTNKLIGIFALGDPVFNLTCRDQWIGWTHNDRTSRLYNVMDVFILGSVPPYNTLLGGKLVAMLAASDKVQKIIELRYHGNRTIIQKTKKNARLALLTTASALGKSSLYDRITYNNLRLYKKIGESRGWGHFHLNHGLFDELKKYMEATFPDKVNNRFGDGPNWKFRTIRGALEHLGLSGDLLQHGIQREIYGIPLAKNFTDFLRGETTRLKKIDLPFDGLAAYWKERWLLNRALRKPEYKLFKHYSISEQIHNGK